ncbi:hypothetical protein [Luteitalea sp.]|uniref:hypothetical protein n=1 Tax=Luteitalea sp. TaxID=2004800 RepID=UPI0025C2903E|nr:hypothetical protein [Luteitalea sp.]
MKIRQIAAVSIARAKPRELPLNPVARLMPRPSTIVRLPLATTRDDVPTNHPEVLS